MYDVIVVGARCAGSPTAMLLARKGYRALLLDRATFPSDTLSTHAIKTAACAQLNRWGLLDRVAATNCPPITHGLLDLGPLVLEGWAPPLDGVGNAYCVRRTILDPILADAAVEAGAELRTDLAVQDLLWDGDRVVGVRGRTGQGTPVEEQARLVVGADGLHSFVARAVNAPITHQRPTLTCAYYSYWSDLPVSGLEIYQRPDRVVASFPTNDGLTVVFAEWPNQEFQAVRSDVERHFQAVLDLAPAFGERARAGRREERFYGTADLPNFLRKPYGPGWALVGDAGCHKDPITAQGITDAFRDAALLAGAADDGLAGRLPLDQALAAYEQRRDEVALPLFQFICDLATLAPPPPDVQQLLGALAGNQADTDCFFGMIENTVPITEFFALSNVERIIAQVTPGVSASP